MPRPKSFVSPSKRSASRPTTVSDHISTFPERFEPLRDQLLERARETPDFLATVFTLNDVPSDDEVIQSVENRLFSLIGNYPHWFSSTKSADAQAQASLRHYQIRNGLREAAPQPEHLVAHRKRLAAISAGEIEEEGLW